MQNHLLSRALPARLLLFALVSLFGFGWAEPAAAQICPMSVEEPALTEQDTTTQRGNGRETNNGRRRKPRIRQPQREGTVETQSMPVDECSSDWTPPSVSIDPAGGTFTTATVNVTITWSDDVALDQWGYYFTLNGVNVTPQFTYSGTQHYAQATGTVTLNPGQNTLLAEVWDQAGNYGSATATYTYNLPIPAPAPHVARQDDPAQVSQGPVHPGTAVLRDLCLTIAVGPGAAYECGDLRLAHALPTTRVLNTARTPTLIYNSQHAQPRPVVPFNLQMNAGSIPSQVRVILWVGEVGAQMAVKADTTWTNPGGWHGGLWRFAASFDGSSYATNAYGYRLQVVARINGLDQLLIDQYGDLAIVNRAASPFGAGWWVAGMEQLIYIPGDGSFLVVGGDGSTQRYHWINNGVWRTAGVERPDTLWASGSSEGSYYYRNLPNGSRVWYNPQLRHHQTVTRLGHVTFFEYDHVGRLANLKLPRPATSSVDALYIFGYEDGTATGRLSSVCAIVVNTTPCRNAILQYAHGDRRVTGIVDPDNTTIGFGYDGAGREVKRRTDRRNHTTSFLYDAGGRLKEASLPVPEAGYTIRHGFWAAEAAGLTPLPTGNAYTRYDAPRTDLADDTYFWVNRWGAPTRIQDPGGYNTYLTRSDSRFPGLVTRVDYPNGRYVTASYDALGNLEAQTDWSHTRTLADGSTAYSTTRYARTDPAWPNFITQATAPEGEVSRVGYHANGSRAWQQPGDDTSRRVRFDYNSLGLVEWITFPATATQPEQRERLEYDARGNLYASSTRNGFRTVYHNDANGRNWKTESPIDGVNVLVQESTFYPNSDLVEQSWTAGPALNGAPAQTVRVRNTYDAEGNTLTVARWSDPDPSGIGAITTTWAYDAAGRPIVEIAPDGTPGNLADNPRDSTVYDPAGNARELHTRRTDPTTGSRLVIRMQHDALGRLTKRVIPAVRYPARPGIPLNVSLRDPAENTTYPRYPTDGSNGYLIAADSSIFAYDELGRDTLADNGDARLRRAYYPNGALKAETQHVRTVTGTDFGQHVYRMEYTYDLNGRRTELRHPSQLAPSPTQNTTRYTYDRTGSPATITDALGNVFQYTYTERNELASLGRPAGVTETYGFDTDGNVSSHRVWNGTLGGYHRSATFQYDRRGKMLRMGDGAFSRDTVWSTYSGLGHVLNGGVISHGHGDHPYCRDVDLRSHVAEQSGHDAMGNLQRHASADTLWFKRGTVCNGMDVRGNKINGGYVYEAGTGRLTQMSTMHRTDALAYDRAGNNEFYTQSWYDPDRATLQDRASYYAADGTLRAADARSVVIPRTPQSLRFTFEEYRYDAHGRRIWVRARNYCEAEAINLPEFCNLDKVRRTVWDGTHELYEVQMPGGTTSTYLENDTGPGELPKDYTNGFYGIDPNPFYGRVAYTHGLGVDQPLSVIRIGYGDRLTDKGADAPYRLVAPFAILPLWDTRGQADRGVYADGRERKCEGTGDAMRCVQLNWPGSYFAYARPELAVRWWHGTVLEDKRDAAGTSFRRNRYYDANTGRFTQEDPIGLAGGLNLYGFADGDPVSFSDPYGLSACPNAPAGDPRRGPSLTDCTRDEIQRLMGVVRREPGHDMALAGGLVGGFRALVGWIGRRLGREAADAVDDPTGPHSQYDDSITQANSVRNVQTDVTRSDFESVLDANGWSRTTSKDGKVSIYSKDGARYVVRDNARSTGGPTADYYARGSREIDLKLRLKQ